MNQSSIISPDIYQSYTMGLASGDPGEQGMYPEGKFPPARRILVVDDEPDIRSMVEDVLSEFPVTIIAHPDRRGLFPFALEALTNGPGVDAVFLDVNLGGTGIHGNNDFPYHEECEAFLSTISNSNDPKWQCLRILYTICRIAAVNKSPIAVVISTAGTQAGTVIDSVRGWVSDIGEKQVELRQLDKPLDIEDLARIFGYEFGSIG